MIIALDYDGTYTEEPYLWNAVINIFQAKGHKIIVVTMRYPSERPEGLSATILGCDWYYTCRKAKKPMLEALGIHPNIWIDDHPQAVFMDAEQIWGTPLPEGQATTVNSQAK